MNLETLKKHAEQSVSKYPQYKGHFDRYIRVKVKRNLKTKMGPAFEKDEICLAKPERRVFTDMTGAHRHMILVWSMLNRCDTSIDFCDVELLDVNFDSLDLTIS